MPLRAQGVAPGEAQRLRFLWSDHLDLHHSTLIVRFALAGDLHEPSESLSRATLSLTFPEAALLSADGHPWPTAPLAQGTRLGQPAADDQFLPLKLGDLRLCRLRRG